MQSIAGNIVAEENVSAQDDEEAAATPPKIGNQLEDVRRPIAEDGMFRVRRTEDAVRGDDGTEPTFQEVNAARCLALDHHFMALGWPPFDALVAVSETDQYAWGAMPDDWRDALAAEGVHPDAEVVGRFERGLNFIRRRVEPLTPDYWLVEEAQLIRQALDAPDQNAVADAAHELGLLRGRAHLHSLHLRTITRVHIHKARLREAGTVGTAKLRKRADPWRRRALDLAQEVHAKRPELSASAAAKYVARALAQEGHLSGRGKGPPGEQAIRKVIAPLFMDSA
jgi:hypothetical protein